MDERQVVSVEVLRSLLRIGDRVLEDLQIQIKFDEKKDKEYPVPVRGKSSWLSKISCEDIQIPTTWFLSVGRGVREQRTVVIPAFLPSRSQLIRSQSRGAGCT